ncbi:hypothetical protein [Salinigranum halophilum]|uniref:hypothetical protein n=1 Tax=Salinigranum halophilum TaxID=2565931 RepID=UPI0010A7F7FD|nr:hypothetical protein [Salinigranum halophilum]
MTLTTKQALVALSVVLLGLLALGGAAGVSAQEVPYNNSTSTPDGNWTDDHGDVTLTNVSHYVSRVSSFVVGNDPADAGVGAIFMGVVVGAISVSALGTSRAGLVASGTMTVLVTATLAAPLGAGFMPSWLFGVVVALIGLVAGVIFIRMLR